MCFDRIPLLRSGRVRLTRRNALGLVGAGIAGGLVTRTRRVSAQATPASATWEGELTAMVSTLLPQTTVPGAIVGVWQDGQPPYRQAFGVQDPATGVPMTPDLFMRIGSNTKSFTTTAILQLVDQGRIDLDDPVALYVPGVPNGDEITIRQLGMMRSGLLNYAEITIPRWPSEP